jgi:molybdopterin-containing oxidoreductase family membrane subunit
MTAERVSIMGLFDSETKTAEAIRELRTSAFAIERVHAPIPSHAVADALALPKSKVGWFTLAGGIIGFFSGFALAAFTATRWNLMVGGKPVVALVPFFIVGFEFTILFAVFGNVLGIISQARLPRFKGYQRYDIRVTGDRFGVLASCPPEQQSGLQQFFESRGAEIKAYGPT